MSRWAGQVDRLDLTCWAVDSGRVSTSVVSLPSSLRSEIVETLRTALGEWAGVAPATLVKSAVYGVREYSRGSVLKRHVDRVQSHGTPSFLADKHREFM